MTQQIANGDGYAIHKGWWHWPQWGRWVAANALGELVGLGGSALVVFAAITLFDEETIGGVLLVAAISILLGTCVEGVAVGVAQRWAFPPALKGITQQAWVLATAAGAFAAWVLGMMPSTIMNLTSVAEPSGVQPAEPAQWVILLLATGMGLAAGPVLGLPQWWVLRKHVTQAGWWVAGNAAAWMVGMPIIFAGAGTIPDSGLAVTHIPFLLLVVLLAGAAVGAVHGVVLLWLVKERDIEQLPSV